MAALRAFPASIPASAEAASTTAAEAEGQANAGRAAATDPNWLGFYDEAYLFVAAIYFLACYGGSRYSRWLERYLRAPDGAQAANAGPGQNRT